jgi:cell division protein FtsW (lipid II flippase)
MTTLTTNASVTRPDRLQMLALAGLMFLGAAFVYSATMVGSAAEAVWYDQSWVRQLVWYFLGICAGTALCFIDYRILARWSFVGYWLMMLLLLAVLVPGIGSMRFGARRWIDLGAFQFQPSEFAKLAFILAQAHFLSRPADELRLATTFWKALGLMLLPFALIMKEPDLGSALVLLPTGFVMMYVAGIPRRFLVRLLIGVAVLSALFLIDVLFLSPNWQIKLEDYQRDRLLVYFGRDFAPRNATAQASTRTR